MGFCLPSTEDNGRNWTILSQNLMVLSFDLMLVCVFPKYDKLSANPAGNRLQLGQWLATPQTRL